MSVPYCNNYPGTPYLGASEGRTGATGTTGKIVYSCSENGRLFLPRIDFESNRRLTINDQGEFVNSYDVLFNGRNICTFEITYGNQLSRQMIYNNYGAAFTFDTTEISNAGRVTIVPNLISLY